MKNIVSSMSLLGILAAFGASPGRAADRPPSLQKGKVLILKNEYTIEGDIERVGDSYRVRREVGESWVHAERVLGLVASLTDAYAYLRGRINLDDPDERLRLARWCRLNGLHQQALTELQVASELRPDHAATHRLLESWKRAEATAAHSPQRNTETKSTGPKEQAEDALPAVEVTTESLGQFGTRVQPILMNTCARCHATGHGGKFHLSQVFEDNRGSRRTLERNLAAVLAEINVNQPEASRLLTKAVTDHAHTGKAPLRDRQATPYRTLESWVKLIVADNPHLCDNSENRNPKSEIANPKSETPTPPPEEDRAKAVEKSEWGVEARPPAATLPTTVAGGDKGKAGPSSAPAAPNDPYDPEPFNRKMHPEANKPEHGK